MVNKIQNEHLTSTSLPCSWSNLYPHKVAITDLFITVHCNLLTWSDGIMPRHTYKSNLMQIRCVKLWGHHWIWPCRDQYKNPNDTVFKELTRSHLAILIEISILHCDKDQNYCSTFSKMFTIHNKIIITIRSHLTKNSLHVNDVQNENFTTDSQRNSEHISKARKDSLAKFRRQPYYLRQHS